MVYLNNRQAQSLARVRAIAQRKGASGSRSAGSAEAARHRATLRQRSRGERVHAQRRLDMGGRGEDAVANIEVETGHGEELQQELATKERELAELKQELWQRTKMQLQIVIFECASAS